MAEQVLRQAKNIVEVMGIVAESTLLDKQYIDKVTGKPYNAISGDVTIQVDEDESHTISYYAKELTKDGAENKSYKALKTAMDKMVSLADLAQGKAEGEATKVHASGNLALNEYRGQDGELRSFPKISGSFAPSSKFDDKIQYKPKATFKIEGIVKSVRKEMNGDDETGRLKIDLYVPIYGGKVIPLSFVTDAKVKPADIDYIEYNFTPRTSIILWGNIINKSKKVTRTVVAGFGDNTEEYTYETVREYAAIGGNFYEEGTEHESKIFDVSLLKDALANRERYLSTLVASSTTKNTKKDTVGFGVGANSGVKTNKTTTVTNDDLDDLFGID